MRIASFDDHNGEYILDSSKYYSISASNAYNSAAILSSFDSVIYLKEPSFGVIGGWIKIIPCASATHIINY
jgi:hypothetical protein